MKVDIIYNMDCVEGMKKFLPNGSIDLTITSPPYGSIRDYMGNIFKFEPIANELYRVTKLGGVVIWVVGDEVLNGSESGVSFEQALYFKKIGFNLHDTMIYGKISCAFIEKDRYSQQFEYMFVLSKGRPKTFNPIIERKKYVRLNGVRTHRQKDGSLKRETYYSPSVDKRLSNLWFYNVGYMKTTKDKVAYKHPAIFPDKLARDHILTWSRKNDIVLDPMCGSGTTLKMAKVNYRYYIGFDIGKKYCEIAKERLTRLQLSLF